jgi:hypothetical protein
VRELACAHGLDWCACVQLCLARACACVCTRSHLHLDLWSLDIEIACLTSDPCHNDCCAHVVPYNI